MGANAAHRTPDPIINAILYVPLSASDAPVSACLTVVGGFSWGIFSTIKAPNPKPNTAPVATASPTLFQMKAYGNPFFLIYLHLIL